MRLKTFNIDYSGHAAKPTDWWYPLTQYRPGKFGDPAQQHEMLDKYLTILIEKENGASLENTLREMVRLTKPQYPTVPASKLVKPCREWFLSRMVTDHETWLRVEDLTQCCIRPAEKFNASAYARASMSRVADRLIDRLTEDLESEEAVPAPDADKIDGEARADSEQSLFPPDGSDA